jgi:multicomponent Na+:H+ antiporter subunit D
MNPFGLYIGFAPGLLFIFGAFLIPLLPGRAKTVWRLALPVLAALSMWNLSPGQHWTISFMGFDLILGRLDALSRAFGTIFVLIAFIGTIYSLDLRDDLQHIAAFCYAGGALGVTFAGDLLTLYLFWEVMAVASTFLILARKTKASRASALRYVLVHVFGGLCLLAGIVLYIQRTGDTAIAHLRPETPDTWLIFIGVAVNAAVFPLHAWLKDAYPEATITGAVFLSAFTTKSAVYVLARMFPGTPLLVWIGALMTAVPIFYAVLENDIRRVLAYSLINQVGFMICGIGIGTELSLNGTVSHAFCHILYKALLFMSAGAVLRETGKIRCTDLGGLYKTMPLTCLFCMVGAASISAFPLFSGFVSKSMIISAAGHHHMAAVWLVLQFASAGVFHHAGIKVPYFIFFGHDSGIRAQEPPRHMLIAMGTAAFLCVFLGIFYQPLYALLPHPVHYHPYTGAHVVGQLQLLMFGALAFCLLIMSGNYPPEIRAVNLDTDWFYIRGGCLAYRFLDRALNGANAWCEERIVKKIPKRLDRFFDKLPVRLAMLGVLPFRAFTTSGTSDPAEIRNSVKDAVSTRTVPVGVTVAAATFFIALFFLLS